jgi:hypothetical protein
MIIDCFSYFNEEELLELRLRLLYNKVDKFIITEADHTHSGLPKHMTLLNTLKRMDISLEKIWYVPVMLPSLAQEPNNWVRERMQRDAAIPYIRETDIAFIGDCDEILNPEHIDYIKYIKENHPNEILRTPLTYLCGRADLRVYNQNDEQIQWNTPFLVSGHQLKDYTLSEIREDHAWGFHKLQDIFITEDDYLKELGWHFTWMGNQERLKTKIKNYSHAGEHTLDKNYSASENSFDPLGRKDHILKRYDINNLPNIILENNRIRRYLLPDENTLS